MEPETFYHVYNLGNDKLLLFFKQENYLCFLRKVEKYLLVHVRVIIHGTMPIHFHLLVFPRPDVISKALSDDLWVMLQSYTRTVYKEKRAGWLFQQHTKVKPLEKVDSCTMTLGHSIIEGDNDYRFTCFHYIRQNPIKAGIVRQIENWEMGSFRDYARLENESLCKKKLFYTLLEIPDSNDLFMDQSYEVQSHIITSGDSMTANDINTGKK